MLTFCLLFAIYTIIGINMVESFKKATGAKPKGLNYVVLTYIWLPVHVAIFLGYNPEEEDDETDSRS